MLFSITRQLFLSLSLSCFLSIYHLQLAPHTFLASSSSLLSYFHFCSHSTLFNTFLFSVFAWYVSSKSQLLVHRKAFKVSGGGFAPQTPWTLDPAGEQPQTPSNGINPLMSMVSGRPQFLAVWCQNIMCKCAKKASAYGERLPRLPIGALPMDHTGRLPKFRPPSSPTCIKWQ